MSDDTEVLHRCALGSFLRHWRASQGLSVEALAEQAHLGHMTWRRLEDGHSVRPQTYSTVETITGLPAGWITRALHDVDALVGLAGQLGIQIPEDHAEWPSFLRSFGWPVQWAQQITDPQPDDLEVASALLSRLTARRNRTEVEREALASVLALVSEWAGISAD